MGNHGIISPITPNRAASKRIALKPPRVGANLPGESLRFRHARSTFVQNTGTVIQTVCKPGSVHAMACVNRRTLDGHSSGTRVTASLKQPTRAASRKPLRAHAHALRRPPLFGLAPGGVYPALAVTSEAVRSYRTVSPLPRRSAAVCFLWHYPWGRPRRPLAGTVFPWSPDFPPMGRPISGRPTVWKAAPTPGAEPGQPKPGWPRPAGRSAHPRYRSDSAAKNASEKRAPQRPAAG